MSRTGRLIPLGVAFLCGVFSSWGQVQAFQAAKFTEHRGFEKPSQRDKSTFLAICSRNGGVISNQDVFDKFLNYELAEFTYPEEANRLPEKRQLLQRYLQGAGSAQSDSAYTTVRKRIREQMAKMAGESYHPFVRVNAMLVLGDLNSKEKLVLKDEAIPDPEALKLLVAAVKDEKQLEAVKAAALLGILRHAQAGIAEDKERVAVQDICRSLTKANNHEWLRRRAIQVLGATGVVGRDGENARIFLEILANKKENMALRCEAARALGSLDFIAGPRINFEVGGKLVTQLLAEVLEQTNSPGGRSEQQLMALHLYLSKLEVGLKGAPDPNFRPTAQVPEPPAIRGMMLAMPPDAPQHKKMQELFDTALNPLIKAVYDSALNEANIDFNAKQVNAWLAANPLEKKELMAGQPDLQIP